MSRKSKRLKKARSDKLNSGNPLIQHVSEKCDFHVYPFCQVVQKHKLFGVAYSKASFDCLFLPK